MSRQQRPFFVSSVVLASIGKGQHFSVTQGQPLTPWRRSRQRREASAQASRLCPHFLAMQAWGLCPRKHGARIATPAACLGYALEPYALRGAAREARRGPQKPPAIRPRQIPTPETRSQQRANAEAWRAILCHAASSRRKRMGRAASRQQEQPPHGGPGVRICTHIRTGQTLAAGCSYKS